MAFNIVIVLANIANLDMNLAKERIYYVIVVAVES